MDTRTNKRYIIMGSGIAGMTAAEEIRRLDPEAAVEMITEEDEVCPNRPMLIEDFALDGSGSRLFVEQKKWPEQHHVRFTAGTGVISIDKADRKIELPDGSTREYDKLIYALGAHAMIPDIPGSDMPHVFSVRSRQDMKKIREAMAGARHAVVVGGGMLGLENAWALHEEKIRVTVVERKQRVAFEQIDQSAGNLMKKRIERHGVSVCLNAEVTEIGDGYLTFSQRIQEEGCGNCCGEGCKGNEYLEKVTVPADLVIFSVGVIPNTKLAEKAGIAVTEGSGDNRWVVVDDHCRTSDPNIYGAGDATDVMGDREAIWDRARAMGRIAGINGVMDLMYEEGGNERELERPAYAPVTAEHVFNGFDTEVVTIGDSSGSGTEGVHIRHGDVEIFDYQRERYIRVSLQDGKIAGVLLINAPELAPELMEAYSAGSGEEEARNIILRWKDSHEVDFKPAAPFRKR